MRLTVRIELIVGRDLQYIRIDGRLVGGLAGLMIGLMIFAITQLFYIVPAIQADCVSPPTWVARDAADVIAGASRLTMKQSCG